jgi:GT2 family glycosyltransferase
MSGWAADTMPCMISSRPLYSLCVSVVVYHSDLQHLGETLATLLVAVQDARDAGVLSTVDVVVVDNSLCAGYHQSLRDALATTGWDDAGIVCSIEALAGNAGYGGGHNVALGRSTADYHLVLNPDITLDRAALRVGLAYLHEQAEVALVCPRGALADGSPAHLGKRMPTVLVLALRAFGPEWLQARFAQRLAHYAMHDLERADGPAAVPLASGCFMLIRGAAMRELGGFDEGYFLYFEDYDLSLRLATLGALVYLPTMQVRHYGGHSAGKGWRHRWYFLRSGLRFFRQYGWRWL